MRTALYARVSTAEQNPDNQIIRLLDIARGRGYEVIAQYVDVASGGNMRRPQLDRMLQDAKMGLFDKVMCVKIDRLARSITNLLRIMEDLDAWGITAEFIDQPIDTGTAAGRMMLTVLGALAEFEKELIRERTMDGLARAKAQGRKAGRPPRQLSKYQIEKAKAILAVNPQIPISQLAKHFNGISRQTLTNLLRKEGIIS